MRVGVLGAAEAHLDGLPVDLGPHKQRALISGLALHGGRPVPPDTLVDLLWGDSPPESVTVTLQGYVARLRRALEPQRASRAPARVLKSERGAYALVLDPDALDSRRFEALVGAVHERRRPTTLPAAPSGPDPGGGRCGGGWSSWCSLSWGSAPCCGSPLGRDWDATGTPLVARLVGPHARGSRTPTSVVRGEFPE